MKKKSKYLAILIFFLALAGTVASQGQLLVLDSISDYRITDQQEENGTWEIYFSSETEGEITFTENNAGLSFETVEYYDGSWNTITPNSADPLAFDWSGEEAEHGRIVYSIDSFDDYSGTLTLGDNSRTVESTGSISQRTNRLDLDSLIMEMKLCSFVGDYWMCDAEEDQPGYNGEIIDLDQDDERELELPTNSDITDLSLSFETVENESLLDFNGTDLVFANLVGTAQKEVITYNSETVKAFDNQGNLIWSYSADDSINHISAHTIEHDDSLNNIEDLAVSTENSLIVLTTDSSGTVSELWKLEGKEYDATDISSISTDRNLQQEDDGSAEEYACIGCGETGSAEFDLPFDLEGHSRYYLQAGLNYVNNTDGDLILTIGDSDYSFDLSSLNTDNVEEIKSDSEQADQMLEVGENKVILDSPAGTLNSAQDYLKIPLAKGPTADSDSTLSITYGSNDYSIDASEITSTIEITNHNTSGAIESLQKLGDQPITYTHDTQVGENSSAYLILPLNRNEGENSDTLDITVNGNDYTASTEHITTSNEQSYGESFRQADNSESIYGDKNITFNLDYPIPDDINAEKVYIQTALSKTSSPADDLTVHISGQEFETDISKIGVDSSREYEINDGTNESQTCIGCDSGLRPEFDLSSLNIDDAGEVSNISAYMCREGQGGNLEIRGSGLDQNYEVEQEVPACGESGEEFSWVGQQVDGSDIRNDYLQYRCDDCDSENHYVIAQDGSTGGQYSRVYDSGNESTISGLDHDFMINVTTDTALDYSRVATEVDRSLLNQGENVTFECDSCDENSHFRLMFTGATSSNTYLNENGSRKLVSGSNAMVRAWTNSSLNHDKLKVRVDPEDISNSDVELSCNNCDEGYNILTDSDGSLGIDIREKTINYEWFKLPITQGTSNNVALDCQNCESDIYTALDSSSGLNSYTSINGDQLQNFGGSKARIWTNQSLNYDRVMTEVSKTDLENNSVATISCEGCQDNAYNIMVDSGSALDSSITSNGSTSNLEGGYIIRQESFGSNIGNEIAASSFPQNISIFNSTGSEIWSQETERRIYDLKIDNVNSETGNEIIAATRGGLEVYSSTGNLLRTYPDTSTDRWIRSLEAADISPDGLNQIIVGTDDGHLLALGPNNEILWEQDLNAEVNALSTGDITKEDGTEIIAGLEDGSLQIVRLDGSKITEYSRDQRISSLSSGNVLNKPGSEVGVSAGQPKLFNFFNLPEDFTVSINSEIYYQDSGIFRGSESIEDPEVISALNSALDGCTEEKCQIPLQLSSSSGGELRISQPELLFDYNLDPLVESQDQIVKWSETDGIRSNEQLRYNALEILYSANPAIPIRINQIRSDRIQNILTSSSFDGEIQFNDLLFSTSDSPTDINLNLVDRGFWLFPNAEPRDTDEIWYDDTKEDAPVELNSTDFVENGGIVEKNVTVSRATSKAGAEDTSFTNITSEINLDEGAVSGEYFIEVNWTDSDEYTDITPVSESCDIYESTEVGSDTFYSCMEDTNGDDVVDRMEVIQPSAGPVNSATAETQYRVGGASNFAPQLESMDITPQEDVWGSNHTVSASFFDQEGDDISANLWARVNGDWRQVATEQGSGNLGFEFETAKEWTGTPLFKIEYTDISSENNPLRPYTNTSSESFDVNRRSLSVDIGEAYSSVQKDRFDDDLGVSLLVRDGQEGHTITENELTCFLHVNGTDGSHDVTTSENGECNPTFSDLGHADIGENEWYVTVDGGDYYEDAVSETQNITLIGNFTYDAEIEPKTVHKPNSYGLNDAFSYNIGNITALNGDEATADISVVWSSIDAEINSPSDTSGVEDDYTTNDGETLGENDLIVSLSSENYNTLTQNHTIHVKDSFSSTLSSSKDVIERNERINLTASFEDSSGDPVNPDSTEFITPSGYCSEIYGSGSELTCEFVPNSNLESKEYNWTVESEKEDYTYVHENSTFEIAGEILADISIQDNQLSRSPQGSYTNNLQYSIENIRDESGEPIENSQYTLYIDGTNVDAGEITGSNSIDASYNLPTDEEVGEKEVQIELEAQDQTITSQHEITVYGILNAEGLSTDNVYIPNPVTETNEAYNTTSSLEVSVMDDLDQPINDYSIEFNTPEGSCVGEKSCDFEPSESITPGEYNWTAQIEKQYYESTNTDNQAFKIQDIVQIKDVSQTLEGQYTESLSLEVETVNPNSEAVTGDGFEIGFADGQETVTVQDGSANLEWPLTCEAYDIGPNQRQIELIGSNEFYTIHDGAEEVEFEVYNPLSPEIISPIDSGDSNAESYRQGDTVDLEVELNAACDTSQDDYTILWEASSRDTSRVVSSGQTSTWTVEDDFSGPTDLTVEIDNSYYENNVDTHEIIIDRVLNVEITGVPQEFTRDFEENWDANVEAAIFTGQGVRASNSDIDESWDDFEVIWKIDGSEQGRTQTNQNGVASTSLNLGDQYEPGDVNIQAELRNTSQIDTIILQETDTQTSLLKDEAQVEVIEPSSNGVFYQDELNLEADISFATGNTIDNIDYSWIYQGENTGPVLASSSKQTQWVVPSYVFGEGNLTLLAQSDLIQDTSVIHDLNGERISEILEYDPYTYVEPESDNTIEAEISLPGLEDKSGIPVDFWTGSPTEENTVTSTTDENGIVQFNWDTRNLNKGAYETGIRLRDTEHITASSPDARNKTLVIPDLLNISASFYDNLESILGTRTEDNPKGDKYPELPGNVVYRNPGPWKQPDDLHLAANVTTPFINREDKYDVDGSTVEFWINGEPEYQTDTINQKIADCKINLTEENTGEDLFKPYHCQTTWNPDSNFPVGEYDLKINASHPEEGWTVSPVENLPVEVRGVLNITVDQPIQDSNHYQSEQLDLSASVKDYAGNEYSDEDLDIRWGISRNTCPRLGSNAGNNNRLGWDAYDNGGRNSLNTWVTPLDPNMRFNGWQSVVVEAQRDYFEVSRNSWRRGYRNCNAPHQQWDSMEKGDVTATEYAGNRDDRTAERFRLKSRIDAQLNSPSSDTVETDDNDILNITAGFYLHNTDTRLPDHYSGEYKLQCTNCSDDSIHTQDANDARDISDAHFNFDFSQEQYNEEYEFKIWSDTSNADFEDHEGSTITKSFRVVRSLGSGEGACTGDSDNPVGGETVASCPNNYGFENLPKEYWLNETASDLKSELEGLNESDYRVQQYNRFANESHEEYEEGVRWYGEHSAYPNDMAGGCDYDRETDEGNDGVYEARDECTDWTIQEEPPEILDVQTEPEYFKPVSNGGTEQQITAEIDAPTKDIDLVRLVRGNEGSVVGGMSTTDASYPRDYEITFTPDRSSDTDYTIEAITQEGLQDEETFTLYYDETPGSIENINIPDRPLIPGQSEEVEVEVDLGTVDDQGIEEIIATAESETQLSDHDTNGGNYFFTGEFTPVDDGSTEEGDLDIGVQKKSGWVLNSSTTYDLDLNDPEVTDFSADKEIVSEDDSIIFTATLSDDGGELSSATLTSPSGITKCSENSIGASSHSFTCDTTVDYSSTGNVDYTLTINDTAGREVSESVPVDIDNSAPTIDNIQLENDGIAMPGEDIEISAEISDEGEANLETTEILDASNPDTAICDDADFSGPSTFTCTTSFQSTTDLSIEAEDSLGNRNAEETEVLISETEPTITIQTPSSGDVVGGTIGVDASIYDDDQILDTNSPNATLSSLTSSMDASGSSCETGTCTWSTSLNTGNVNDGSQSLEVRAQDRAGREGQASISLTVDNTAPAIELSSPDGGETISGSYNFQPTITETNPSTQKYTITGPGGNSEDSVALGGDHPNYETGDIDTTEFQDGGADIEITAVDKAGNQDSLTRSFNIDNNPPVITITSPNQNEYLRGSVVVEATIDDAAGNEDTGSYSCSVGGETGDTTIVGSNNLECEIDTTSISSGQYDISVSASDTEGHSDIATLPVWIDNEGPSISDLNLDDRIVNSQQELDITADITVQGVAPIISAEDTVGDGSLSGDNDGGTWTGKSSPVTENQQVNLHVEDEAGNTDSAVTSYTVDDTAPTFSGMSASPDYMQSEEEASFSFTITEENMNQGTEDVTIVDSSGNSVANPGENCDFGSPPDHSCSATWNGQDGGSNVDDGDYRFKVSAEDLADNSNQHTHDHVIRVDNTPPEFRNFDVSENYVNEGTEVEFSVIVDELSFEPSSTQINLLQDGSQSEQLSSTCEEQSSETYKCTSTWTPSGEDAEGDYSIEITSTDSAGNDNSGTDSSASVTFDPQDPVLDNQQISGNGIEPANTEITVTVDGTDNTHIDYINADGEALALSGNDNSDGTWEGTISTPSTEGDHTVTLEAKDAAGNIITDNSLSYEVDDTAPNAEGLVSDATYNVTNSAEELQFNVTVDDPNGNLDQVLLEGTEMTHNEGNQYTLTTTPDSLGLPPGENTLTVEAIDLAGNIGTDTYDLVVEDEAPTIGSITLEPEIAQDGAGIDVTAEIEEDYLEEATVENKGQTTQLNGDGIIYTTSVTASGSNEEQVTVNVTAVDQAGNSASDTATYTIDEEAPSVSAVRVGPSGLTDESYPTQSDENVEFTVTVTDNLNLSNIEMQGPDNDLYEMNSAGDDDYTVSLTPSTLGCPTGTDFSDCTVDVIATDAAGNTAGSPTPGILGVDDVEPEVSSFITNNSVIQSGTTVELSSEATDNDPEFTMEVEDPNGGTQCELQNTGEDIFSCETVPQDGGTYTLTAADRAGNENTESSVEINIDNEAPQLQGWGSNATFDTAKSDAQLRLSAEVTDDFIDTVEARGPNDNLVSMSEEDGEYILKTAASSLGCPTGVNYESCNIEIVAIDEADNIQQDSYSLFIDDVVPVIANVHMSDTIIQSDSTVDVSVDVDGEGDQTLSLVEVDPSLDVDNSLAWDSSAGNWTGEIQVDNSETLNVYAEDYANNNATHTNQEYTIDDTPPSITDFESNASHDVSQSDEVVEFSLSAEDNVQLEKVEIRAEGSSYQELTESSGGQYSIDVSPLDLGCMENVDFEACVVDAKATDTAGNTFTESYELTIDDIDPPITNVVMNDTIIKPDSAVEVQVDIDGQTDQRIKQVLVDEQEISWTDNIWTGEIQVDNSETLNVYAEDYANNNATHTNQEYTIDDTRPEIHDLDSSSDNDIERSDTLLNFTVTALDENGVANVYLEDQEMQASEDNRWRLEAEPGELGCSPPGDQAHNCTLNATVTDNAGWTNYTTYNLTVDDSEPVINAFDAIGTIEGDPYDAALATFDLDWRVDAFASSKMNASLYAVNHANGELLGGPVQLDEINENNYNFGATYTPQEFNATEGLVDFTVNVTDQADNIGQSVYTVDLDTVPPNIVNVTADNTEPETTRDTIELQTNITHNVRISEVTANITHESGETIEALELSLPEENEHDNNAGGIFIADFTPPRSGDYSIEIYAEDEFDEFDEQLFESVFTAIGKTKLDVTMIAEDTELGKISNSNNEQFTIETFVTNIGNATAYGSELWNLNSPEGVYTNSSFADCGDLPVGDQCSQTVTVNITADANPGINRIFANSYWENPDRTTETGSNTISFPIEPNPILEALSSSQSAEIRYGESEDINFEIFNEGNLEFPEVQTSLGSQGLSNSKVLQDSQINIENIENLEEGTTENATITILPPEEGGIDQEGTYITEIDFDGASEIPSCSGQSCADTAELTLDVFRSSYVNFVNDSDTVYRNQTLDLQALVENEDTVVEDYPVNISVNDEDPEPIQTNSEGVSLKEFDLTSQTPGIYSFTAEIGDLEEQYHRAENKTDTISYEVRDELHLDADYSDTEVYWYETDAGDDQISVEYNVTDVLGEPVEDASATLETNTSSGSEFEDVGTCVTGSEGLCTVVYTPQVDSPQDAELRSSVEKNEFYDVPANQTQAIDILGGFSARITEPEDGQKLIRGRTVQLNASVLSDDGEEIDPTTINWSLTGESGLVTEWDGTKTPSWNIPEDQGTGLYNLSVEADDDSDSPPSTDTIALGVYEGVNLSSATASTDTAERAGSEVTFNSEILNSSGSHVSGYESCQLTVEDRDIDTATSGDNECSLIWNTGPEDQVGPNIANVSITEFQDQGMWYLPDENISQVFTVNLTEEINLDLIEPPKNIYAYENITFAVNETDAFNRPIETDVEWRIDGELVGTGNETEWNTSEETLGPRELNVTSQKEHYNTSEIIKSLNLYGQSEHEFELEEEYNRGAQVPLQVNVTDVNSTEPIPNYSIDLYRSYNNGDADYWRTITTNENGLTNDTWDTSDTTLGNYTVIAELGNDTAQFYNGTTGNISQKTFVGGELVTEVTDISNKEVYRDQLDEPLETDITINTEDELQSSINNVLNEIIIDNRTVGNCTTTEDGSCTVTWDPDNQTEIGELTGFINSTSENFFPTQSEEFNISVRTGSKPDLDISTEIGYNFSKDTGIPINNTVLESFTNVPIENYDFNLGWGVRDPVHTVSTEESEWESDSITSTSSGLQLNNTSATLDIELEEIDLAEIILDNNSTTWSLNITTEQGEYFIESNSGKKEILLDNATVESLELKTNDTVTLNELTLSTLALDNRRELMDSEVIGSFNATSGDFKGAEIQDDLQTCGSDPDCNPHGWYVEDSETVNGGLGQGTFGTPALELNITEMGLNESTVITREYDPSTNAYEDFELFEFWMNSELSADVTFNSYESACTQTYDVNATEWTPTQLNLTQYHDSCGERIDNIELEFENTLEDNLNTTIAVDQFRRYRPANTTEDGLKALNWLPPGVGEYAFKLEIEDSEYYNVTKDFDIIDVEVTSTGGGTSPVDEEEEAMPDEPGSETFTAGPEVINQTVGANTYGTLDRLLEIENLGLEDLNMSFGIVEGEELIKEPNTTVVPALDTESVPLEYETQEPGNYTTVLAAYYEDERQDVEINLNVRPVEMEIREIGAENGVTNITPGDQINFNASLTVDDEVINESVTWSSSLEESRCSSIQSSFNNETELWELSCEAPTIPYNPLSVNAELSADYGGLTLKDSVEAEYQDITGPFVTSYDAENVEQTEETRIELRAFDNVGIYEPSIEAQVEYLENGTEMGDISFQNVEGDLYEAFFDNTTYEGDYDIVTNLTDVNSNVRTVRIPLSVDEKVNVSGSIRPGTRFEFRRPRSNITLDSFTTFNDTYNFAVQNRSYDMEVTTKTETTEGYEQEHSLDFIDSEINNDIEDPITVLGGATGEEPGFEHPEGTTNYTFSSVSYSTNIAYQEAKVTLDYQESGVSPDEDPEEDLTIYRCEFDEIENCTAEDWTKLNTTVNTTTKKTTARTGTSSSYIIERQVTGGEDDENNSGDGENDEENSGDGQNDEENSGDGEDDAPSSGGGGGGGGAPTPNDNEGGAGEDQELRALVESILGEQFGGLTEEEQEELLQGLDEEGIGEMSDEEIEGLLQGLMEDLASSEAEGEQPFIITPRIYHPVMERGETRTFFMEITNNQDSESEVNLSASGEIEDLISFVDGEVTIPASSSTITEMIVSVPEESETGSYSGSIAAQHEDFTVESDHQILIVREGIGGIEMSVQSLTQNVPPGDDLTFEVDIGDIELTTPLNATMEYFVRKSETDEVVAERNETLQIDNEMSYQREIELGNDLDMSSYYIQVVARHQNLAVSDSATFTIGEPFWTPFRRQAVLLLLAVLLITVSGWKGYQYYWERKESEARYVFPVDYSKLPDTTEDNYHVGKIAETEQEARIDPDDLTTHAIVSGSTGSGKSVTASVIVEEALENDVPVVVFDPTAQWTGFVKELKDDNLLEHYPRFDMDKEQDPHPYRGTIQEIDSEDPNIDFEELKSDGEITVFTLDQLTTEEFDQAVRKIIDQIFQKEWEESPNLEMLIVFDEVHRLLEEYGGDGGYHALEKGAREFRKWGIGLMMCSQVTADFKQAISGNIMTEIQMQTKSMSDIDRVETKYGEEFAKRISSEDVGTGMIQNSNYNDGDPWFVDFRPTYHNPHKIPDKELQKYHDLSKELSELKERLESKKDQGEDVRDKDLELQLAENKLKEGRFKMAKMYINSLKDEMEL